MTAILKRIDDPRDALDRARRPELVRFARANGLNEISENMPAMLIRKQLRARGLTRIAVNAKPLGSSSDIPIVTEPSTTIDALDDLERQFATPPKPVSEINRLRAEMKRLGIKASRRDNIIIMRAKIEAHGKQDPA